MQALPLCYQMVNVLLVVQSVYKATVYVFYDMEIDINVPIGIQ